MLGDTYEITVADLEGALKKQNLTLQRGDAVIMNTGWGRLFGRDNARYGKSNPGIGLKAAEWLIAKDPMLLGADVPPSRSGPTQTRFSPVKSTSWRRWSTASIFWKTLSSTSSPPRGSTSSPSWCSH
jgi:kynurenine formamidase